MICRPSFHAAQNFPLRSQCITNSLGDTPPVSGSRLPENSDIRIPAPRVAFRSPAPFPRAEHDPRRQAQRACQMHRWSDPGMSQIDSSDRATWCHGSSASTRLAEWSAMRQASCIFRRACAIQTASWMVPWYLSVGARPLMLRADATFPEAGRSISLKKPEKQLVIRFDLLRIGGQKPADFFSLLISIILPTLVVKFDRSLELPTAFIHVVLIIKVT